MRRRRRGGAERASPLEYELLLSSPLQRMHATPTPGSRESVLFLTLNGSEDSNESYIWSVATEKEMRKASISHLAERVLLIPWHECEQNGRIVLGVMSVKDLRTSSCETKKPTITQRTETSFGLIQSFGGIRIFIPERENPQFFMTHKRS